LRVVCEGEENEIKRILSFTPFEFVSNKFVVVVSDFNNCSVVPWMDAYIAIPVRFQGLSGGFYAYMYEDNDAAIAAGREMWGYPKKFATTKLEEKGKHVSAIVERKDVKLIEVKLAVTRDTPPEVPIILPVLLLQVIPNAGKGVFLKRVISTDRPPTFVTKSEKTGKATVSFGKLDSDPLYKLGPTKVIGGSYRIGDFEKSGWPKVLATL
jgi:acetoacetate decarboxylase